VIRALGGEVSWDKHLFPGATFDLDDDDVTHLIIDRPQAPHKLGRVAVQPQWAFDSANFKGLLPTNDYVPGAELPPHLSPFVKETEYQPPEQEEMERKIRAGDTLLGRESDEEEVDSESGEESEDEQEQPVAKKTKKEPVGEVQPRAVKEAKRDKKEQPQNEIDDAERNLAKKAIVNKKRKRLLERIEKGERKDKGRIEKLKAKRTKIDEAKKMAKKVKK